MAAVLHHNIRCQATRQSVQPPKDGPQPSTSNISSAFHDPRGSSVCLEADSVQVQYSRTQPITASDRHCSACQRPSTSSTTNTHVAGNDGVEACTSATGCPRTTQSGGLEVDPQRLCLPDRPMPFSQNSTDRLDFVPRRTSALIQPFPRQRHFRENDFQQIPLPSSSKTVRVNNKDRMFLPCLLFLKFSFLLYGYFAQHLLSVAFRFGHNVG